MTLDEIFKEVLPPEIYKYTDVPHQMEQSVTEYVEQECLKARLVELDLFEQAWNNPDYREQTFFKVDWYKKDRLKDLETRLDERKRLEM